MENIEEVTARAPSTNFSTHRDHSKWVVAARPEKPYVCIGDINRMVSVLLYPDLCLSSSHLCSYKDELMVLHEYTMLEDINVMQRYKAHF